MSRNGSFSMITKQDTDLENFAEEEKEDGKSKGVEGSKETVPSRHKKY